ncbi:MAG: NAD(P)/FAD-dependent oxidoreductase [Armatimonadota bacterium]
MSAIGRRPRACIIGGGIAGLTVAYELCKTGIPATVYEAQSDLGGLAASIRLGASYVDKYYHFACGGDWDLVELCKELGVPVLWQPTRTSYLIDGTLYPFTTPWDLARLRPLGAVERARLAAFALQCRWLRDWRRLEDLTARDWLIDRLGIHTYDVVWNALLSTKFGEWHDQISASWLWHRIWRVSQSRRHPLAREQMGYTEGGTHSILSALAREIRYRGGSVVTGCPVVGLTVDGDTVRGLSINGSHVEADIVVSTVPLPCLASMLPDGAAAYRGQLLGIEYIGVVCLMLGLRGPLTDSFWVNVNDGRAPFNGIIEYGNLDDTSPLGTHVAYIPMYVDPASERYRASDEGLRAECIEALEELDRGFGRERVEQFRVFRDLHAQPICPPGFSQKVPGISSPIKGLYVTDSTQLYPEDRNRSGMVRLAKIAAQLAVIGAAHVRPERVAVLSGR